VGLGREARRVADRPDDLRGQYGTHTEDIGEGGAGSFYLGFYAPIFRSAIFLSSVRMSRSTSEANRRRRRAEVPWGRIPRRIRAARWADSVPATPPGTRSRRSPCRRLSALVRSATRSSRLSESRRRAPPRRPRDRPLPAARCARRPTRWRGHRAHRSCGRCRSRAPALVLRAWAVRPPPTRRPLCQPHCQVTTEAASVLDGPTTLGEPCRPERSRALKPARFCRKVARSTSSPVASSTTATATLTPCGDRPRSRPSCVHAPPFRSELCHYWRTEDTPTSWCAHTSFESLRRPRAPAGREPRTSQPLLRATGSLRAIPILTGALEA
jgi:hypothetical protein